MGRTLHALVLLGAAMAALGGAACAAPDASEADAEQGDDALIGGKTASAGQFAATVYLKSGCTATKVAPKRLLTAALAWTAAVGPWGQAAFVGLYALACVLFVKTKSGVSRCGSTPRRHRLSGA